MPLPEITPSTNPLIIALAGSPASGKAEVFDKLTASLQERVELDGKHDSVSIRYGKLLFRGRWHHLVDLPGIFSLGTSTEEEAVACNFLLTVRPDLVINVLEAGNLPRQLPLTLELFDLGLKLVLALNISHHFKTKAGSKLARALNVPVILVRPKARWRLEELLAKSVERKHQEPVLPPPVYDPQIEAAISNIAALIAAHPALARTYPPRWLAIKLLEDPRGFGTIINASRGADKIRQTVARTRTTLGGHAVLTTILNKERAAWASDFI